MKLGSQSSRRSPLTVGRATTRTVARAISRACSVLLTGILLGYQRYLSPLKPSCTCRFVPCCSQYAIEAIRRRGPGLGTWMAAQRVLRCNPLFRGGFDPVPEPEDEHKERRPTAARLAARSR